MLPVQPAGGTHRRPAAEKAEDKVSANANTQQNRERFAGQEVAKDRDRVQGGDEPHQAAQRKSDQAKGDAVAMFAENMSEGAKQPGDQSTDQACEENQQRQLEIHHGHGSGARRIR